MREPIKQSVRFSVFSRDWFRCRYCGKSPDQWVKLQVDHIIPVAEWWWNEIENLATACFDCNIWKWKKLIKNKIKNRNLKQETKDMQDQIKVLEKYYEFLKKKHELENKQNDLKLFTEIYWYEPTDFWKPHVRLLIKRYGMDVAVRAWSVFCDWRIRDVPYLFWIGRSIHNEDLWLI